MNTNDVHGVPAPTAALAPEPQDDLDRLLSQAHAALDADDVKTGRALALQVLKSSEARSADAKATDAKVADAKATDAPKKSYFEASALLCLAHCDRMVSRYRRAHRASQRAAHIFQQIGHLSGEVMALSTHAIVSVNLGRNEEAVEAALLSVRLSELLPRGEHSVLSYNYLGIAYYWSRSFDKAEQAFAAALKIAQTATPPLDTFQPRVNQWWAEVIRIFYERYYTGHLPALDGMYQLKATFTGLVDQRHANITTASVVIFSSCLHDCWQGDLRQAMAGVDALAASARQYGSVTWLNALEYWVMAEISWTEKDLATATLHARKMIEIAVDVEHEQLACLGHLLVSQLFVEQGDNGQALDELRRLRLREQLIRTDCLESREKVVGWQVENRQSQQSMLELEKTSRQLEKLSLEDALTGIANRRSFDQYASSLLRHGIETGRPPCIALIDVDRFKQINDTYSHQVGDEVLKTISLLLKAHVREEDMPARLAGDEFVIAFKHTDLHVAELVCERIRLAVKSYDWATVGPGLEVRISVGVVKAHSGDTIASVTHRSDMAMYEAKRQQAALGRLH